MRIILPSTAPPSILNTPHPFTIRTTPVRRPQRVLLGTHQSGAKGVEWCRYDEPAMPRTLLASLRVQCVHGPRYWLHRQAVVLKQGVMRATQNRARAHTLTLTHRTLARTHSRTHARTTMPQARKSMHAFMRMHACACMHAFMRMHSCACIRRHAHASAGIHARTHTHAHRHTFSHVCARTRFGRRFDAS